MANPELVRFIEELFRQAPIGGPEPKADENVSESIVRFLGATMVSSDIEFDALAKDFCTSRIPEKRGETATYLGSLAERVVAHSVNTSSPMYMGHMTSALPYFVRSLSRLITALNQNLVKVETAKALTPYEREAIGMLHRLLYQRDDAFYATHIQERQSTLGIVTSGGTLANVTALWIARNAALAHGTAVTVERGGLADALRERGIKRCVVIGSALMHYSLEKAADILGIGTKALVRVGDDTAGRVDVAAVRAEVRRQRADGNAVLAIIGIAGTTDSGAIDDLDGLADVAAEEKVHFHVDAAWGGPLLFSQTHRPLLRGIERADSVTIDGHKQLYLPMGIGTVLLKDPDAAEVIEKQSPYIIRKGSHDLGRRALEGSRPGMALYLHAALHVLGCEGYEYLVDEGVRKARHMATSLARRPEFELLTDPVMNIVNYRVLPSSERARAARGEAVDNDAVNQFNVRLQEKQRALGRTFVSRTTIQFTKYGSSTGIVALRAVLANPLTSDADIDTMLDEQVSLAGELSE